MELSERSGMRFGGYAIRRFREGVEVMIVVRQCISAELCGLFHLLREFDANRETVQVEEVNHREYGRLRHPFTVIRQGQEPDDFSKEMERVPYEVASSIHSNASSRV